MDVLEESGILMTGATTEERQVYSMSGETGPRTAVEMVLDALGRVENLTPAQVVAEVEGGEVLLVDLREIDERGEMGWIADSLHAPRGMLEFHADDTTPYHLPKFERSRRIVVYCSHGARSALAVLTLHQMGYGDVAHLAGGLNAWMDEGLPLEFPPDGD